ncbi:hypothetical protein [Azospirillum sp.]|uniref:hypothetical protein n=1 Tax=Azospirillum sp. TaxID=34012 RepID=UPI003D72B3BA
MSIEFAPATRLDTVTKQDPQAIARLMTLHPVFGPGAGLPGEVTLGDAAEAIGLPLDLVMAYARGEVRVQVQEGRSCGCGCNKG